MLEEQLDMLFMRERSSVLPQLRLGEVNAGFAMIRCNERTLRFWRRVLKEEELKGLYDLPCTDRD